MTKDNDRADMQLYVSLYCRLENAVTSENIE